MERQDVRGDVALAWTRIDSPPSAGNLHVEVAFKPAGKAWLPQEDIGPARSTLQALAMDASGTVSIAYTSTDGGVPAPATVVSRARNGAWGPTASFGTPVPAPNGPYVTGLVTDDAGDLLFVYYDKGIPAAPLRYAFRPAGGAWRSSAAVDTPVPGEGIGASGLGMAANGVATLLEGRSTTAGEPSVVAQRFTPAGGWQPPTPIFVPPPDLPSAGAFAVSQAGEATFAVIFPDGRLMTASRAADAHGWSPLTSIASPPPGKQCQPLQLAVDSAGEAIVACAGVSPDQTYAATYVAMRAANGTWGPLGAVATNSQKNATAQLAMADDGHAFLNVIVDPKAPDISGTSELLELLPGKLWAPAAQPFAASPPSTLPFIVNPIQASGTVYGGPGRGITAVQPIGAVVGQLITYGLSATVLTQPSTVKGGQHPNVRLVGRGPCADVRHPCHTPQTAHLAIGGAATQAALRLTVSRLRAGTWRLVRTVRVRIAHGRTTVRLPVGRVRVSTASVHDMRKHAWAAYLLVR